MLRSWGAFTVILVSSWLVAPIEETAAKELSIGEAISYALQRSPVVGSARSLVEIRRDELSNARAKLLPSLDLSSNLGWRSPFSEERAGFSGGSVGTFGILLTETVYDNGSSWIGLSVSKANVQVADLLYRQDRDALIFSVMREFYSFSRDWNLLEIRRQQRDLLRKQLQSVTDQYRQGRRLRTDYVRLKARMQNAEVDLLSAEFSVEASKIELRRIMGYEGAGDQLQFAPLQVLPMSDRDVPAPEIDVSRLYARQLRVEQGKVNELNTEYSRRRYGPEVNLSASAGVLESSYIKSGGLPGAIDDAQWAVVLSLRYNLVDWGTRRRDVAIADRNREIADNALRLNEQQAVGRLDVVVQDLKRAKASVLLNEELVALELQSFEFLDLQYREGKVSYLDLITGLDSLFAAKARLTTSYFDYLRALAEYQFLNGKIYEQVSGP